MPNRNVTNWREANGARPFLAPLTSFRRELDRLFDDFLVPGDGQFSTSRDLQPDIEVQDRDNAYAVTAELPGIEPKDVQVDLNDNILTIAGEKRQARDQNDKGRHYSERSYGRFERLIPLEREIDADKIEAKFSNGVLTVTLPKSPQARDKSRHIEIKSQ